MPFTFSHPAAVLPATYLPRRFYSLTGLIIGSMVPDFEYFMRLSVKSVYSHTWAGLFWFDLPMGLVAAFVFHNLVRNPLFFNSPLFQRRLIPFTTFQWNTYFKRKWPVVLACILVGAASHIVWDSLTHKNETIPFLNAIYVIDGNPTTIFEILQRVSSVLGGVFVFYAFYRLPPLAPRHNNINPVYWILLIGVTALFIGIRWKVDSIQSLQEFAVVTIGAVFAALILSSSVLRFMQRASGPS